MAPDAKPGLPKLIIPTQGANGTVGEAPKNVKQNGLHEDASSKPTVLESKTTKQSFTPPSVKEKFFSSRWRLAGIISLGNFVIMTLRGSTAMAIVCMSGPGGQARGSANFTPWNYSVLEDNRTSHPQIKEYEFNFDEDIRSMVLSATMYSGFFMPFIGGILSQRFGAKNFIFVTIMAAGICFLFTPEMTRLHEYALIVLRFCIGLFTVGYMAALQDIWSKWAPQFEKVSLVSISIAGINLANMFASLICGYLCTIEVDNGWPFIFYIFGSLCVLWCCLWFFTVTNSPEEHRFITEEEQRYIIDNRIGMSGKKKLKTPWKKILTCKPVWAFIVTQSCNMWCAVTLFMFLPVYFNSILGFSIEITGALLSIPFFFRFVGSLFWGFLSDILLRKTALGVTKIRKLIQATGFTMSAVASALVTFVPFEYRAGSVAIVAVLLFFQSSSMSSSAITPLDVAPRFAGILTGLCMVMGTSISVIVPFAVTAITFGGRREVEWRIVFCMLSGIYLFGMFVFITFSNSELQPWATDSEEDNVPPEHHSENKVDDGGIDNIVFEIETPSQNSPGVVSNNTATRRNRTISAGVDSAPRTPVDISVALVQPSEIGTPELVMKFPRRLNVPISSCPSSQVNRKDAGSPNAPTTPCKQYLKSPLANVSKPDLKQIEPEDGSTQDKNQSFQVVTSVVPFNKDENILSERL